MPLPAPASTMVLWLAGWAMASGLQHDVPAVITQPTAASRAELRRVVQKALGGVPVALADDALTRDGTLIIERARRRDATGAPLLGRDTGRPEQFHLVQNASRCVLVHESTGRRWVLASARCSAAAAAGAAANAPAALTGQARAAGQDRLEGVLVSARAAGSPITVTVVTDDQGRYRFPAAKLPPGRYALSIRAVGYDLLGSPTAEVADGRTATADLTLGKAKDLASQLTNTEWLASFPGTEQEKGAVRNCAHCHRLDLVARSRHDAAGFLPVLERMSSYPPLAFPLMPQKLLAARVGGGEDPLEHRRDVWRRQAEYLSHVNLSAAPAWSYPMKTLPRPTGAATRVIYTEYELPQRTRQPHDVIVDSDGMAWYASFGEQILGKLDPRTGKVTEYPIPLLKPRSPTGVLGLRFDKEENLWLGMQFQAGLARFDRKTAKFQTWSLPPELNGDHVQVNQVSAEHAEVDGKVWAQDAGTYTVLRLDVASGKWEAFAPFPIPRPNIYDVISDARNNVYFTVFGGEQIGRIDSRTGAITLYRTPAHGSGPRRGMMDEKGRLWFGENHADRIGMFDTRTEQFQEWRAPTPESWPYDVTVDRNGQVWAGGEYSDRVLRLDPATGRILEYLLPRFTNVRRVFVDNRTTPVTFWVGNNHGASIVKLEPLE